MKNLGKTIDKIIKIDPDLEKPLVSIKNKWKQCPSRASDYWKELLDFLNSESLMNHPKRMEIRKLLVSRVKIRKQLYSFEEVNSSDVVIGVIPENIADILKRCDRKAIKIAKMKLEANITHDTELLAGAIRKEALLDISIKKAQVMLKDHFKLWSLPALCYDIKMSQGFLVLVQQPVNISYNPGITKVRADSDILRLIINFLKHNSPDSSESNEPENNS